MRKLVCPQCKVAAVYVKNEKGDRLPVYVTDNGQIVPKDPKASLDGFNLEEVFCLDVPGMGIRGGWSDTDTCQTDAKYQSLK